MPNGQCMAIAVRELYDIVKHRSATYSGTKLSKSINSEFRKMSGSGRKRKRKRRMRGKMRRMRARMKAMRRKIKIMRQKMRTMID